MGSRSALLILALACTTAVGAPAPKGKWGYSESVGKLRRFSPLASEDAPPPTPTEVTTSSAQVPVGEISLPRITPPIAEPPVYRGSTLSYRNVVSALSFNRGAEPTYNPYYAMQLALAGRYWFNKQLYARGSFDVLAELTQSDTTPDRFVVSDLGLAFGGDGYYTIPVINVDVSTEFSLALPTSKASQAATRMLSTALSLGLSRKFGAFSLSYSGAAEKFWNRYTTGAATAYLVGVCEVTTGSGCIDMLIQSGRRNANFAFSNGLSAAYKATPWLSFSLGAGVSTAFLYPLEPRPPEISLETRQTSDVRFLMLTNAGVALKPTDELTVGFGVRAAYAQLAPDGSYRVPLLNRFTQMYLELGLNIAGLVSKLRS